MPDTQFKSTDTINNTEWSLWRQFFKKHPQGLTVTVPVQRELDPGLFKGEFRLLFQISRETQDGEHWDFRIFFKDVNGLVIKRWIAAFNIEFSKTVLEPLARKGFPMSVFHGEAPAPVRNQIDFLILNISGRCVEEIVERFFKMLRQKL